MNFESSMAIELSVFDNNQSNFALSFNKKFFYSKVSEPMKRDGYV